MSGIAESAGYELVCGQLIFIGKEHENIALRFRGSDLQCQECEEGQENRYDFWHGQMIEP